MMITRLMALKPVAKASLSTSLKLALPAQRHVSRTLLNNQSARFFSQKLAPALSPAQVNEILGSEQTQSSSLVARDYSKYTKEEVAQIKAAEQHYAVAEQKFKDVQTLFVNSTATADFDRRVREYNFKREFYERELAHIDRVTTEVRPYFDDSVRFQERFAQFKKTEARDMAIRKKIKNDYLYDPAVEQNEFGLFKMWVEGNDFPEFDMNVDKRSFVEVMKDREAAMEAGKYDQWLKDKEEMIAAYEIEAKKAREQLVADKIKEKAKAEEEANQAEKQEAEATEEGEVFPLEGAKKGKKKKASFLDSAELEVIQETKPAPAAAKKNDDEEDDFVPVELAEIKPYLDDKAVLHPFNLPDAYTCMRHGFATRQQMRKYFITDHEFETLLEEEAPLLQYESPWTQHQIDMAKVKASKMGMTHEDYKDYHDARVKIEKILSVMNAYDPVTGRALLEDGTRDASVLSPSEQAALPAYTRLNEASLFNKVDRHLTAGADLPGAILESLGYSQEFRRDVENEAAMKRKSKAERDSLREQQYALSQLPAGSLSLEKRKEMADKAYGWKDQKKTENDAKVSFLGLGVDMTMDFNTLMASALELSESEFLHHLNEHLRNPIGFNFDDIPAEFHDYFKQIEKDDKKNPKKALLTSLGLNKAENPLKTMDLLPKNELAKRVISSDHIPAELRKAGRDYLQKVRSTSKQPTVDAEVDEVLSFLNDSKKSRKQVTKEELNKLVTLISELDNRNPTVKTSETGSLRDQRRMAYFKDQLTEASNNLKALLKPKKASKFETANKKATTYLNSRFGADYKRLKSELQLADNSVFQALVTEIHANHTSSDGSNLVLDRFVNLLMGLRGETVSTQDNLQELFEVYRPTDWQGKDGASLRRLAQDADFMMKFRVLALAKQHNKYSQADELMKSFALACTKMPESQIAKRLEYVLNTDVVVRDPRRDEALELSGCERQDYHTLDSAVLHQPDFPYLNAASKIKRVEANLKAKKELDKAREVKTLLSEADDVTQRRLMSSFGELEKLIDYLDSEQDRNQNTFKMGDVDQLQMAKKASLSVNELAGQIIRESTGIEGVTWDNMEQVYNPLNSGVLSLARQRVNLVSKGMSVKLADDLCQRYLNQQVRTGSVHSLMDFFSEQRAKNALHHHEVSLEDICLNYQSRVPGSKTIAEGLEQMSVADRVAPVRPSGVMGRVAARFFSAASTDKEDREQAILDAEAQPTEEKSAKFSAFLQAGEDIDQKIAENADFAKSVDVEGEQLEDVVGDEGSLGFDSDEIDIEFNFEGAIRDRDRQKLSQLDGEAAIQFEDEADSGKRGEKARAAEKKARIQSAKQRYGTDWFKRHSHEGPVKEQMTQLAFEKHLNGIQDQQEFEDFVISMANSGFEANDKIGNLEMTLYNMFMSPISTYNTRTSKKDDLLAGNLFAGDFDMPTEGYMSLLETLALKPKKKHLKKIIQHLIRHKKPEEVDPEVIDMITFLAIDQKYPILMGNTLKFFLQNGYNVNPETFQRLIVFLERCKGFEEDAKRFITLSTDTEHIQVNYKMVRPFFLRCMKFKSGQDLLQLFEQIRKNLKLNKSGKSLSEKEHFDKTKELKREFYDGLMTDLIDKQAFKLALVTYDEKEREKFPVTIADRIFGIKIYSSQLKLDEFREIFQDIVKEDSEFELTQEVCEVLTSSLRHFQTDAHQTQMLDMFDQLQYRIERKEIEKSSSIISDMVTAYTETQQWSKVSQVLNQMTTTNAQPEQRLVSYLKKNMVYIMDTSVRANVRENVESMEARFFSNEGRKKIQQEREARERQLEREAAKARTERDPLENVPEDPQTVSQELQV